MQKIGKKILASLIAVLILCTSVNTDVFAGDVVTVLDFTTVPESYSGDGYEWDQGNLTLTVTDLTLNVSLACDGAIMLPDGATLVVAEGGTLDVTAYDDAEAAIYGVGDLTIEIYGTTTLTSDDGEGIYSNSGDVAVNLYGGNLDIESEDSAIYAEANIYIYGTGNVTLVDTDDYGLYGDDIIIDVTGDLSITAECIAICSYSLNMTVDGNATIVSETEYGLYAGVGDIILYVDGTMTITAEDEALYVDLGDITLGGTGTITLNEFYGSSAVNWTIQAPVTLTTTGYIYDNVTVQDGATVNTLISQYDSSSNYNDTVTGDFVPASGDCFYSGTLSFAEGSSLTVNDGVSIDLTGYTIDFTNANITNNGRITLPYGTDLADIDFAGIGVVYVEAAYPSTGESTAYDNQGNKICSEDIYLTDVQVTNNPYYSWTVDADGVYTFESFYSVIDADIYVEVADAVFNLTQDTKIAGLMVAIDADPDSPYNYEYLPTNLTITGDYTLQITGDLMQQGIMVIGSLTIDEGTTVEVSMVSTDMMETNGEVSAVFDLTISGTLKASFVAAVNLTVTNTGTLILDLSSADLDMEDEDGMPCYMGYGIDVEPTVTLGDQVKVISPEGATFITHLVDDDSDDSDDFEIVVDFYMGYFVTTDGDMATTLYIGLKPSYDITVSQTGEGSISPSGSTVSVIEGFDQTFTFTAADGYELSEVIIDGESWGAIASYTFEEVMEAHTLEVVFVAVDDGTTDDGDVDTDEDAGVDDGDTDADEDNVAVETGDSNAIILFTSLALISAIGLVVVKKRQALS